MKTAWAALGVFLCGVAAAASDPAAFVNPFIGTSGKGHCNPCAACPFGMVQPGPDTGNAQWDYCGGYQYRDTTMLGFSQGHLSGSGQGGMGDFLLLPQCGDRLLGKSSFDHAHELAEPGYYAVTLDDAQVRAEMTCSERVAYHRYTYLGDGPKRLLLDLQHALIASPHVWADRQTLEGRADFTGDDEIRAQHVVRQHWPLYKAHAVIRFSRPIKARRKLDAEKASHRGERWLLEFDLAKGEVLEAKVALSYVDFGGAARNLDAEVPDWDFSAVRVAARAKWNAILGRLTVEDAADDPRTVFYTCLYHLCFQPNVISDVGAKPRYSTFSLWDTFRAAHPLYTLLVPERVPAFVGSLLDHAERTGIMPVWEIYGAESYDMVGAHSIPVVLEAYRKGLWKDLAAFYPYVKRTQTEDGRADSADPQERSMWDVRDKYGYYPCDLKRRGGLSWMMETAYDDWCAAEMAKELGNGEDEAFFRRRSRDWRNLFHPKSGWLCPRESDGAWYEAYDPTWLMRPMDRKHFADPWDYGAHFRTDTTEGSGAQWSFHVLHDVAGLVETMGGRGKFVEKLDFLFTHPVGWEGDAELEEKYPFRDVCGRIGEYAHGNEPCHHVPYLYTFAGERAKAARWIRAICDRFYSNGPDGICGNDDCGQMSAWYVFACLGFYPVNPASAEYAFGMPCLPRTTLTLANGRRLTVRRDDGADGVSFNGRKTDGVRISHRELLGGGELVFGK